jgi:hypothetical protein
MAESRTDIVIRPTTASDTPALWRLAALDDAPVPHAGPDVLIAEVDGQPLAALVGDRAIADPFRRTAPLVELLRLRAHQLAVAAQADSPRPQGPRLRLRSHAPVAPRPLPQG